MSTQRQGPLRRPKPESRVSWCDDAIDPGNKGPERAEQKMRLDYDGDATQLKDLARLTLICNTPGRMVEALEALRPAIESLLSSFEE